MKKDLTTIPLRIVLDSMEYGHSMVWMYNKGTMEYVLLDKGGYDVDSGEYMYDKLCADSQYVELPNSMINNYELMMDWASNRLYGENREKVIDALMHKYPFDEFRSAIVRCGVEKEYEEYRHRYQLRMALKFCRVNGLRPVLGGY